MSIVIVMNFIQQYYITSLLLYNYFKHTSIKDANLIPGPQFAVLEVISINYIQCNIIDNFEEDVDNSSEDLPSGTTTYTILLSFEW